MSNTPVKPKPRPAQSKKQREEASRAGAAQRVLEKFETLRELTAMVAAGISNSLLVSGPGGVGKSFTVIETLRARGIPFQLLRGYASPSAFYNFFYAHSDALIVVDDCDNIFKDMVGLNILKAVLETMEPRTVSWQTPSAVVDIREYQFTGRVIFLTNLGINKLSNHLQAMLTRVHVYHLELSPLEVLAYIKRLAIHSEYKTTSKEERLRVVRFLRDNHNRILDLNIRHYVKALDLLIFSKTRWRKLFMSCMRDGE